MPCGAAIWVLLASRARDVERTFEPWFDTAHDAQAPHEHPDRDPFNRSTPRIEGSFARR